MSYQLYLNTLIQGQSAIEKVGMVPAHAQAFMRIARQQYCVISSRSLGEVCTGLVEEGYDSKGMRIKAKSCDFGPMAGFVCGNPLYNKKGAQHAPQQAHDIHQALSDGDHTGWAAGEQQICISEQRLQWLRAHGKANPQPLTPGGDVLWGTVVQPVQMTYLMRKEVHEGDSVWALYETSEPLESKPVLHRAPWEVLAKKPLTALVNPYPAWGAGHYKNCVTGDYDLFAVWPRKAGYDPTGEDRRIAGMPRSLAARDNQAASWEDRKLGNISNRIHTIAQMINSILPKPGGHTRDMLHHSDEGGRPHIDSIELPVIAFIPGPGLLNFTVAMENLLQMRAFTQMCDVLGFQVIVNAAWGALGSNWTTGDAHGWQTPLNSPARGR